MTLHLHSENTILSDSLSSDVDEKNTANTGHSSKPMQFSSLFIPLAVSVAISALGFSLVGGSLLAWALLAWVTTAPLVFVFGHLSLNSENQQAKIAS